jgi:hypothetical protein
MAPPRSPAERALQLLGASSFSSYFFAMALQHAIAKW